MFFQFSWIQENQIPNKNPLLFAYIGPWTYPIYIEKGSAPEQTQHIERDALPGLAYVVLWT